MMNVAFDPSELNRIFQSQRAAFQADMAPDVGKRTDRLDRLLKMVSRHAGDMAKAISADFSHRSRHETELTEVLAVISAIRHAKKNLGHWMKARRLPTARAFRPAKNQLIRQPLGVVGVIAPWNYPLQLSLSPAVGALAAGNRVMIKPSDMTPRFAGLLREIVDRHFAEDELAVVTGGVDLAKAFVDLPFDHLLFTGSAEIGREVAQAAARNLTPVTLELGGKSPAIIDVSADLAAAARKLAYGKLLNAGQTCVAPDYVLVPRGYEDRLVAALRRAVGRLYPRMVDNPDYTSIANDRHLERLRSLLDDAEAKGAALTEINPGHETLDPMQRKMFPTLVLDATGEMRVMQEEIFGPILPILPYDSLDEVIDSLARCDRPLALYWFGSDQTNRDRILHGTVSGGVAINDCIWQVGQEAAPFGGVGASGHGAYHGETGFCTFSKEKPVFYQSRWSGLRLLTPPYGPLFSPITALLRRII
ncbi:coniferyl aldehyde dehydrogenase [Telmatospirillum sp.]|uniref:coniferyl aldehyde dehydrogenase n=1 Tax=Telmatospirillum sp. TaxID=2079197 RepID=UPI00284A9691|nr:coniferyl aldehyde dehydrogenase [Telmatospirillum sp.]MDR3440977.1 coniferyl aldehyde dehydrogenase [Telmatospirillum sp.]